MHSVTKWRGIMAFIAFLFAVSVEVFAQIPKGVPNPPEEPVDLSETSNIIIFIVLPALVLIGFFFWRSAYKRRKEERDKL